MADLPKIAMQRLHEKSPAAAVHLDPNLMSAFVENALPSDSRAQVVQHLAQCRNCREVVFLATPDQAAALPASERTPSHWLSWPVLRWGAAVAAVVVVAAAVSLHHPSSGKAITSGAVQQTDAPRVTEKAVSAPAPEVKQEIATKTKVAPPLPLTGNASLPIDSATAAREVPGRAKDAAADPASNGDALLAPPVAGALRPRSALFMSMAPPRWTLTSDGTLQRSFDFGRTWQSVPVPSQASFRALAASGKDIWIGGSKGALYHSRDAGQSWTQVQPVAAGQALTDDIIGVEFPDADHGKLTTLGKDAWITEDAGQTWHKQ
jgi:hypothetical protein